MPFNKYLQSNNATNLPGMAITPPFDSSSMYDWGGGGQGMLQSSTPFSTTGTPPAFDWGQLGNVFSAGAGGLSFIEGVKDLFGRSDADKQRKFAKDWSMRQWNTNALMHDNQLQRTRNIQNDYNRVHGTNYGSNEGLRTLGTWGSGKNRVPSGG